MNAALENPHRPWGTVPLPAAVTMDVFDTALTRCWAKPGHVFLVCAQRLRALGLTQLADEAWMQARHDAEGRALARCGADMATLQAIYAELSAVLNWTPAQAEQAGDVELAVELDSARVVPRAQAFQERVTLEKRPFRFLSDMYWPEHRVAQLLERVGYRVGPEAVWVSSQRQASKSHGALFTKALAAWPQLQAKQVVHVGDNRLSDVRQARRAGWQAWHFADTQLPAGALRLLSTTAAPLQLRSLVAGAMRLAQLQVPPQATVHEQGLWQLGGHHAGPMLTLYVWWLLLNASQAHVKRLYFLARDGQVLLDIARILQTAGVGAGIELRYLYASRQAWFAPSLTQWTEAALFRVLDEPDPLHDPAKLSRRLGFDSAQAMSEQWPQLTQALHPGLSNREVAQTLVRCVPAATALAHMARLRSDALSYFEHQGLFDGVSWGLVDLGWRGRMQECLTRIVQCHPKGAHLAATGYYLGLFEAPQDLPPGWQALAFGAQGKNTCPPQPLSVGPAHLLELFCEADHGSTQGYAADERGVVQPVFKPHPEAQMVAWGLATYRQAVACYATQLASSLAAFPPAPPQADELLAMAHVLGREFFSRAPLESARAFANMPCSHSVNHDTAADLAAPFNTFEAWCRALSLGRWRAAPPTHWLPGSLARSSPAAYRAYVFMHKLANKLRGLRRR
jgi:hypothetical protein